mmetsp:Transcript_9358/g.26953  ORF Transcript_9358/g.26953 Transcript_9358/m.26953 type:complete len:246 (+) Transcript_9358:2019-2756(+)
MDRRVHAPADHRDGPMDVVDLIAHVDELVLRLPPVRRGLPLRLPCKLHLRRRLVLSLLQRVARMQRHGFGDRSLLLAPLRESGRRSGHLAVERVASYVATSCSHLGGRFPCGQHRRVGSSGPHQHGDHSQVRCIRQLLVETWVAQRVRVHEPLGGLARAAGAACLLRRVPRGRRHGTMLQGALISELVDVPRAVYGQGEAVHCRLHRAQRCGLLRAGRALDRDLGVEVGILVRRPHVFFAHAVRS